jgi:hypothetical protein
MSLASSPKLDSSHDGKSSVTEKRAKDVEGGGILAETHDVFNERESGIDPVYQAKARILNDAFQEIGMGKYQVCSRFLIFALFINN